MQWSPDVHPALCIRRADEPVYRASSTTNRSSNGRPTASAILCAVFTLVPAPFSIDESIGREMPIVSASSADVNPATIRALRTAF